MSQDAIGTANLGDRGARVVRGALILAAALAAPACLVEQYCFEAGDCPGGQVCDAASGQCRVECVVADDCGPSGFECELGRCAFHGVDAPMSCPDGMVPIEGAFCIDRWEASRPDATLTAPGADGSRATSRPHVMPWIAVDPAEMNTERAAAARAAAGKRLCAPQEWRVVCRGPLDTTYSYGDAYDPVACNGLDTFCRCEGPPYPGCHGECGASVHAVATGTFPECASAWGVFDLNGNAWELVASEDGLDHYRGGAYNCLDPARLHDCDYEATWNPSAKGFRCCADGERAR